MSRKRVPKDDEDALQELLDAIEREVRERYWNGNWSQSGAEVQWHTAIYRGD